MANRGSFRNIYEVHKALPAGGETGDYVLIMDKAHYWNPALETWVVTQARDEYWDELLQSMSDVVGEIPAVKDEIKQLHALGYVFGGKVLPLSKVPSTVKEDSKVFFLAGEHGVYLEFDRITVGRGQLVALIHHDNNTWSSESLFRHLVTAEDSEDETEYAEV